MSSKGSRHRALGVGAKIAWTIRVLDALHGFEGCRHRIKLLDQSEAMNFLISEKLALS